ncbi:MAG: Smr/MutS family protein [Flavobacteriales bacterium]|nr:Smr/MutS family protein [Flavobacteriales bacterium]
MEFAVGDKVKFVNESLEGEVVAVNGKQVRVACSDGFDHDVAVSELILIRENDQFHFSPDHDRIKDKVKHVKINQPLTNNFLSRYTATTKYQFDRVVEIDLHLEELVEFPGRLDDWQKLHTQLQHVKKCLSAAMDARIKRMVFIHGKGTGVLKAELLHLLGDYDNLIVKEADFRAYGGGATEVYFK